MAPTPFVYQDVFGGSNVYPSDISYALITLTSDVTFAWPLESAPSTNNLLLPRILDVQVSTYKMTEYNLAGTASMDIPIRSTTFSISVMGFPVIPVGAFVTFDPNGTLAPAIYQVTNTVYSGSGATITIALPLASSYSAGASLQLFTFTPWTITLPDATRAGIGQTTLFVSTKTTSAYFNVKTSGALGMQLLSAPPGSAWQTYITDNTTQAGIWSVFQYGSQLATYQTSGLAGPGLTAYDNKLATSYPVTVFGVTRFSSGPNDRAQTFVWTAASGAFYLPTSAFVGNNWFTSVRNQGSGVLTLAIAQGSSDLINTTGSVALDPGDSCTIITDGRGNFYTLGFGRAVSSTFDYTTVTPNPMWQSDYALTNAEQNRIAYSIEGQLTGPGAIVVPQYIQQYWISNDTTGPYQLTIKAAGGDAGLVVGQGKRAIYYCDGIRIVEADNAGITFPLTIPQGGTGATSADTAILELNGGASQGQAIFKSANITEFGAAVGGANALLNYLSTAANPVTVGASLLSVSNSPVTLATATASINAMGGVSNVNQVLGAASIADILALSIALG